MFYLGPDPLEYFQLSRIEKMNFAYRLILLIAGLLAFAPLHAAQTLVLNTAYLAPVTSPDQTGYLDLVYKELGKRTGIHFVIQPLSGERALLNANEGIDDGDVGRIAGLDKTYPNLVRVPELLMSAQLKVFSREADFVVTGADSLKPYDVAILTGWKIVERTVVGTRSLVQLETFEQMFDMLGKGRVDLAIAEEMMSREVIRKLGLRSIKTLDPALLKVDWYLYLNKKHAALVPQLEAAIRQMRQDGTLQKLQTEVLDRYRTR